jgi:type VI secretion system protein ImpH
MLTLFHRAWAQGRPAASRDRRRADRFLLYVGALCGLGLPSLQEESGLHLAKLRYAGLLASDTKHPDGLRALLLGYFDLPVQIQEFVGDWLPLQEAERFQLGYSLRVSSLGRTTVLGARVFSRSHKFRVVLGPLRAHDLSRFLPRTSALEQLSALVKAYVGDEFAWDLELVPALGSATQLCLGRAGRLGFDGVLGSTAAPIRRAHVIVDPFSQQTERLLA